MDIGHSRLFKFFKKSKMEKHQLKIEVLNPSSIESEVPKQHILRENSFPPAEHKIENPDKENVSDGKLILKQGDTVESYVPVITVKTEETNFGKEGLKYQRVKVTEDISVNFQHLFKKETKPGKTVGGTTEWSPRGLLAPVHVGEPVRPPPRVRRKAPEPPESLEDKNSEEKKVTTRIPVSRFKTAVDKVQRERKESEGEQKSKKQAPDKPPRLSSIPKLSDRILASRKNAYEAHTDEQTDKINEASKNRAIDSAKKINGIRENDNKNIDPEVKEVNVEESENFNDDKSRNNEKLEDEFDKLYEEIVDKDVEVIPDEILDSKVKDPEKLEIKFEEIVHQYDEEVKVEPSDKARYSRIPLLKRRSEQEIKVPKQERRLSLKTSNITKVDKTKLIDSIKNDTVKLSNKKEEETENGVEDEQSDHITEINNNNNHGNDDTNDNDNKNDIIEQQHSLTLINDVMPTPDTELVKVGISHLDIALKKHDNEMKTNEIETKVLTLDESIENHAIPDNKLGPEELIEEPHTEEPITADATALLENHEIQETTDNSIVIGNEILSENKTSEDKSVILHQNDTVKVAVINFDDSDELKSVKLLRSVNSVEERTKSRFINKPVKKENDVKVIEKEDNTIVEGKINGILNRLNTQENTNVANEKNDKINEKVRKEELPAKGNVSKILNRITNQDIEDNVKKEFDEMPKKRSVLSKIALFERPDLEPVVPKKPIPMYPKPQRTISEEVKHSPKIVHEVLKPNIRKGQTDKHEVVAIDILKPVEVVTNIEEEIMIVEDLKEETIAFENLDEPKVENNATEIGPSDENNKDLAPSTNNITHAAFPVNNDAIDNGFYAIDPKVDNRKHEEVVANYVPVKEKINRLLSYEENNMKRAKSTAELDLGDAVKGKVKNMIYRMNSFELLDDNVDNKNKETINAKERPRKRSVSEKIALFEKKLTPVKMETVDSARSLVIDAKPSDNTLNTDNAFDEEVTAKIKALLNAKLTYGSVDTTYMELADGSHMPVLALGTALLDPRLAKHIVAAAIDLGFRAIDTAYIYGNEKEVGEGIRDKIQDGTVRREDLFIISKLWSTFHQPELVEPACRASLRALGLEYVDLYVIHNPMSFKEGGDPLPKIANVLQFSSHDYLDAWFAMERLVPRVARRLGVSNFNSVQLARVLDKGRVAPVINQVECHPYLSQQRLSDFCEERGVKLSCFGVLGSKGTPEELKTSQEAVIDDPLVQVMAAGLGISSAQLLISYKLHCGHGVVVKSASPAHLWDNLQAVGVPLTAAHIEALYALNRNKRAFTFKGMGDTHRNYPFKVPY